MASSLEIEVFFDEDTCTATYLVYDLQQHIAVIIDPVLNFDQASGTVRHTQANALLARIDMLGLSLHYILETHIHADHLTAAAYIREKTIAKTVIGNHVTTVQAVFADIFDLTSEMDLDGSQFDLLVDDGSAIPFGTHTIKVMHTPGHTPACLTYCIDDNLFVGDTIFMPDYGSARCDFPGGDASALYQSIQKILAHPADYKVFVGHDYAPGGRAYQVQTTVKDQIDNNIHIGGGRSEADFVKFRTERDAGLAAPALILPSLQVNIRAGALPNEHNAKRFLKIPISIKDDQQ